MSTWDTLQGLRYAVPMDTFYPWIPFIFPKYLAPLGYRIWRPRDLAHTLAKGDNTYVDRCESAAYSRLSVMW